MYPVDDQTIKTLEQDCKTTREAYNKNKSAATLRHYLNANIKHLNSLLHPDIRLSEEEDTNPAAYADSVTFENGYFD